VFVGVFAYTSIRVFNLYNQVKGFDIKQIYVKESTKVYDINQTIIAELGVERRNIVQYEDISKEMIHAITAIEDERFFDHDGIDYKRVFGAMAENIKARSFKEGASTITQQLVKLSFLTTDKTLERKIKEMFISLELEKELNKEDILEAYLNRVLFGGRIYGISKASEYYFHKDCSELTYDEAALLAGMVQSPNFL
jgi:penicillin-binding protein 1A